MQISRLKQSGIGRLRAVVLFCLFLSAGFSTTALAITSVSTGYNTDEKLSVGSIVSINKDDPGKVVGANNHNVNNLLGVVIDINGSLLAISNNDSNQVQVATSGTASVLVSDINGEVKTGDQITASPISGVGMKATNNSKVIGVAQSDAINSADKQEISDDSGKKRSVTLGQVPIVVSISFFTQETKKTIIPSAIQNLANKEVEPLPIIVSMAVFVITLIIVSSIIYSMIRSSIISVGRNPMSQSAVYRDVIQISALVLGILAVAFVAIYMILTRL